MMIRSLAAVSLCIFLAVVLLVANPPDKVSREAHQLHFSSLVFDTHDDTPERFAAAGFDLGKRNTVGHVDIPRMREGGLNAVFFSIWIDGHTMGPAAIARALDQLDAIRENVRKYSSDLMLASTADDVRRAHAQGKIAVLMGLEGGHMMGNDVRMLRIYRDLGVRYVTLTHMVNTEWADSSTDKPAHDGLTDAGKDMVREMNRQGLLVDVSHASDKTFYDALAISKAPLIASHSSCRALCDHPRNLSDEMIKALAAKGGVIQINYEKSYLDQAYKDASEKQSAALRAQFDELRKNCGGDEACLKAARDKMRAQMRQARAENKLPPVSWERIVDHIDHAVKLVGADHVGLGSDFDGASMPDGMDDVTHIPQITEALLRKGYSKADIRKILGENTLRLLVEAERVSREMQAAR